jgi:hypothetical protein
VCVCVAGAGGKKRGLGESFIRTYLPDWLTKSSITLRSVSTRRIPGQRRCREQLVY